jgi:hypothetical protein
MELMGRASRSSSHIIKCREHDDHNEHIGRLIE